METSLVGPGLTLGHEKWQPLQGDPTLQPLYQGARVLENANLKSCSHSQRGTCKVAGSNPMEYNLLCPFFHQNFAVMMEFNLYVHIHFGEEIILKIVAEFFM